jgi:signal transduction histidine kinase
MKLSGFLNLKAIGGQIAALVVASIATLHLIITASFLINRPDRPEHLIADERDQLVLAAELLGTAPASERPRLLADLAQAFPQLKLQSLPPEAASISAEVEPMMLHGFGRHLGAGYRVFALAPIADEHSIGVALPDGAMISAKVPAERPPPFWGGPWMMTALFAVISVTLLGVWAARALTAPLSAFAKAAENFSLNGAAAPLPERGPQEIRAVARALNRMQERITALVDDRTKMLAAISHDLRTPITRLRLRCEFIEDEAYRARMLADLDQMRSMLEGVLSFLQNDRRGESMTLTDIASSLQLVADQFADMGHKVAYVGPDHAMATVRPDDLHRCITNLVENAVRFGTETTVRLTLSAEVAAIEIEDDGPGISDSRKDHMLQPFVRGDGARNMDEAAGFGLGLSIANAIVLAHGGELSLHDCRPQGLRVRVQLPIRIPSSSPQLLACWPSAGTNAERPAHRSHYLGPA